MKNTAIKSKVVFMSGKQNQVPASETKEHPISWQVQDKSMRGHWEGTDYNKSILTHLKAQWGCLQGLKYKWSYRGVGWDGGV